MAQATLHYFDGRGKAELIRLLLSATGIQFTEVFLEEKDDIEKLRREEKLAFEQVPFLAIDGLQLVQTGAINRYLARKAGIYGKTNEESTLVDMYYEGSRDFQGLFMAIGFQDKEEVLKVALDKSLARYIPVFNKRLTSNNTGYLVGDSLTLADVGLLEPLLNVVEYFGLDILKDFTALKKFYERMTKLPNIESFLKGPQRKRPNDDRYVATVQRVLY